MMFLQKNKHNVTILSVNCALKFGIEGVQSTVVDRSAPNEIAVMSE